MAFTIVMLICNAQHISKLGIGTNTPSTTLEVVSEAIDPTVLDGITIPKLTCVQLIDKTIQTGGWSTNQLGTIIYITNTTDTSCNATPPLSTVNTNGDGFYILVDSGGILEFIKITLNPQNDSAINWIKKGNTGTNPATDFVGTTDMADLIFKTNNNEALRINTRGEVGIGTNIPKVTLHIAGKPNDTNYLDGFKVPVLTCFEFISLILDNGFNLGDVPINTMLYITETDDIRCSYSISPDPPYSYVGTFGAGLYMFDGNEFLKIQTSNMVWTTTGNSGTDPNINYIGVGNERERDLITITDNTERIRIKPTGNVGIGTTAPNSLLDVNGTIISYGPDFILGNADQTTRGNSGHSRVLSKWFDNALVFNFNNDFGSSRVDGPLKISLLTNSAPYTLLGTNTQGYVTSYPTEQHTFFESSNFLDFNGIPNYDSTEDPNTDWQLRVEYTPFYENSTLLITCDALYNIQPTAGSDRFMSVLGVLPHAIPTSLPIGIPLPGDATTIGVKYQRFNETPINNPPPQTIPVGGGGSRSSTLFPISGTYSNTDKNTKYIAIGIYTGFPTNGNDILFNVSDNLLEGSPWINCHIIEIPN